MFRPVFLRKPRFQLPVMPKVELNKVAIFEPTIYSSEFQNFIFFSCAIGLISVDTEMNIEHDGFGISLVIWPSRFDPDNRNYFSASSSSPSSSELSSSELENSSSGIE